MKAITNQITNKDLTISLALNFIYPAIIMNANRTTNSPEPKANSRLCSKMLEIILPVVSMILVMLIFSRCVCVCL